MKQENETSDSQQFDTWCHLSLSVCWKLLWFLVRGLKESPALLLLTRLYYSYFASVLCWKHFASFLRVRNMSWRHGACRRFSAEGFAFHLPQASLYDCMRIPKRRCVFFCVKWSSLSCGGVVIVQIHMLAAPHWHPAVKRSAPTCTQVQQPCLEGDMSSSNMMIFGTQQLWDGLLRETTMTKLHLRSVFPFAFTHF